MNYSSVESDQEKVTDVQDQLENPNDSKDPSAEKKELLFAIDEEIADEEDKVIAKTTPKQYTSSLPFKKSMRHLHVMDKSGNYFSFYFSLSVTHRRQLECLEEINSGMMSKQNISLAILITFTVSINMEKVVNILHSSCDCKTMPFPLALLFGTKGVTNESFPIRYVLVECRK